MHGRFLSLRLCGGMTIRVGAFTAWLGFAGGRNEVASNMKLLLFIVGMVACLGWGGCVSRPDGNPNYKERANQVMTTMPRKETETLQERGQRESAEKVLDTAVIAFSEKDVYEPPKLLRTANPEYPLAARRKGLAGSVKVATIIDEQGAVLEAKIISSTDPIFEAPALDAVKQWRFTPAKRNGQVVKISIIVPVSFQLQ